MDLVKALLVFFVLSGCTEVASQLPLTRAPANVAQEPRAHVSELVRLGPPNPGGTGARRIDRATAKPTAVALY